MTRPPSRLRTPLLASTLAIAIGACVAGTGGESIQLTLAFQTPEGAQSLRGFETHSGWRVSLTEARIALGAVYLNENPSLLARVRGGLEDMLVPTAHAHPGHGHFAGGQVRGEWLGQIAFDALSPSPAEIGGVPGIAGAVKSFTVLLDPPRSEHQAALHQAHAWVVGEARRDAVTIAFEGGLILPDDENQRVDGVALEGELEEGARVTVWVDPTVWFDEAQFDRLLDDEAQCEIEGEEGRCVIAEGNQVHTAWLLGARSAAAISGTIEPPSEAS